ncbi:putative transposase, Ptta/En/Spm, plant [Helianthus anomalus]
MSVILMFKPACIRTDTWKEMIDHWNTPTWKAKSKRNKRIRSRATGGKHTLRSQSYATVKKAAKILGREPLDPSGSSSLVSDVDSEGNVQEENLVWVDDRAEETWVS